MKENTCTVPLAFGDVDTITVAHQDTITQITVYECREDEPLIVADLTDQERQAMIRALNKEEAVA